MLDTNLATQTPLLLLDYIKSNGFIALTCQLRKSKKQVCDTERNESIPDCPKLLEQLINDCRAVDPFHRPSAGVLVDKLQIVVAQLENQ
ncbi:hypothetical protein INR49_019244 [Caranx melampygus]|nr:hypothetical protein INR49_019244 [Caranx melampygus]